MIHYIKIFLFIRLNKGLCYCIDTFRSVHLPFASVINVINNVWMMLLTAFISPKLSPVPFITKLLAVKNRPEAKAIIHPIILRPNLSKLLIRIINHHILSARNFAWNYQYLYSYIDDCSYPSCLPYPFLFRFLFENNSCLRNIFTVKCKNTTYKSISSPL